MSSATGAAYVAAAVIAAPATATVETAATAAAVWCGLDKHNEVGYHASTVAL